MAPGTARRRLSLAAPAVLAALAAAAACPAPAAAHPFLIESAPAARTVAPRAPASVSLSFTEAVDPGSSSVHVTGPGGRPVRVARPRLSQPTTLTTRLAQRPSTGIYHVRWVARGKDGHTISGGFAFGVPGSGGAPPPRVEQLGAPGVPGSQRASEDGVLEVAARWLGIVAAGVLLAGFAIRRLTPAVEARSWRRAREAAVAVGVVVTAEAMRAATSGVAGSAWHELTSGTRGQLALVRVAVLLAAGLVLALRDDWLAEAAAGAGGVAALVTYALEGHVESVTHAPALAYGV
ncbi:MAG TPA: copper resistance CopC family protein, partial [Thermoleophilaceae bacterium]